MLWILLLVGVVCATSPPRPPPAPCGPNEHIDDCPPNCPTEFCSALYSKFNCSGASTECNRRCRCDEGFFRNEKTKQCITGKECMINCGPNEVYIRDNTEAELTCSNFDDIVKVKKYSACVCENGHVRLYKDGSGPCVRPEECPSQQCPCNEHWGICPVHCPDDTYEKNKPGYNCVNVVERLSCKPRCVCNNGYLRDKSGKCLPRGKYPDFCPKHEHWEDCSGWCPRDSCASCNPHFRCPQLPDIALPCHPDCVCDKGYLRNSKGICVCENKCPTNQTCGVNEIAKPCTVICPPQSCASLYTLYKCVVPQPCVPGCDCLPGYLRNQYGQCIRSEQCPTEPPVPPTIPECGPNRVYKKCGPLFPDTCDSIHDSDYGEGSGCIDGCFCEDGYVENADGNCVLVDDCPPPLCFDPHEEYKRCGPGCDATCEDSNAGKNISCAAGSKACIPGCYCKKGYYRDENGSCVSPQDCPTKPVCSGENEVFLTCGSACPDTCENYDDGGRICTKQCVRGCFCAKGFVRRQDGACVKPDKCPPKCGYNEEYNLCASNCPVTCSNRFVADEWACILICRERCECVAGTLRNSTGVCVPVEECTPAICNENEEYQQCGTACPDTCLNYDEPNRPCTKNCVEDCFCTKGYVRNDKWKCVKPEQCPPNSNCSMKPHEVYTPCNANCEDTCENYDKDGRVCTLDCRPGCICEKGYVRRNDGQCVRPQECTPRPVCSLPHEEYSECNAHCQRTCDNYKQTNIVCSRICKPGCVCKKGYVRRQDGLCVKRRQCPHKTCPRNEHSETCPTLCPRDSCATLNPDYKCPPLPAIPLPCKPDCVCDKGYLRNDKGDCVPIKNCPSNQTCGVNEAYTDCIQLCPRKTCEDLLHPPDCDKYPCKPGCDCANGYLRNRFGQCIRKEQCQQVEPVCGTNEQFYECTTHCPITCRNRFSPPGACILSCKVGCDCAPGYIRHDNGTCVLSHQCSKPQCPKHSKYQKCGSACEPTCGNLGKPPLFCIEVCVEGCFCDPGYVKNYNGECVKLNQCPTCKVNERYVDCVAGNCGPKTCDDLGFPTECAGSTPGGKCKGGCICIQGYVKNSKGICIPKENCPSCGGDFNATSGCGNNCGHTCSDYKKKSVACPLSCLYNGCDCRKGFVYDQPTKKCVAPKDCLKCGLDQYFDKCPPNCPPQVCSSIWSRYDCSKASKKCHPQCRCKDGFLRNDKTNQCITVDECLVTCDINEHYVRNGTVKVITCSNFDTNVKGKKGISGCVCDEGYARLYDDGTGPCVRPEECPSRTCPSNQHWENCPSHCPDDTCMTNVPGYICPQYFAPLPCKPRCTCDAGYLRDKNGKCVPSHQCPHYCPQNEHFNDCPGWCPRDSCAAFNPHYKCPQLPGIPLPCYPDCVCDDGYSRNPNGICVLDKKCPKNQTCGVNEVARKCKILCPPQTCASIYTLYRCVVPQPCEPGCDCLPGHLRNQYGMCVRSEQCPQEPPLPPTIPECGPHRVYKKCGPVFPDNCDSINDPDHDYGDGCAEGCFCDDGYVENNKGACVPVEKCPHPSCSDPNEVYIRCGPGCDKTCDDSNDNRSCAAGAGACVPGCYCRDGYVRNENGACVVPKDCPPEPVCLLPYEVYNSCGSSCPDTCENYKDQNRVCTLQCVAGCFCQKGYVRRADGSCVTPDQCPKACGYNEFYDFCGSSCPINCANRFVADEFACAQVCVEGCNCVQGTFRNDSGTCVPLSDCTPPVCRKNQEYQECGTACPDTCLNYDDPDRICTDNCVEDCFCIKGYVRDDKWECIKPEQCPPTSNCSKKPHEVYSPCSAHCEDTCEDYFKENKVCTYECRSGCTCEKGYVRRKDGLCVRPQECPPKPICSLPHEEYSECNAQCQRTCDNYKQSHLICPAICRSGCVCKKGYVRRHDGLCVRRRQCPNKPCPKHEHWASCAAQCPRDSCASRNPHYKCPQLSATPQPCQPDCVCNWGYLRGPDGSCIPAKDCPTDQTCGVNEVFSKCKRKCPPQTCDARLALIKCKKPVCEPGCDCIAGHLRNKLNQCIRAEQCDQVEPKCGKNEQYYECTTHCPKTCKNRFLPPPACIKSCKIGCDCAPGYIRHDNGTCVQPNKCSKPKCVKHATYNKCGSACPLTCGNIGKPPQACIALCVEGCFCNKGYVKNELGQCVKPKDCTVCPINERYVNCVIGYCGPRRCKDLGFPIACAGIPIDGQCDGGCICVEGYVRNDKGLCIPKDQCPSCGGDFNATSGGSNHCGNSCSDYDKKAVILCPSFSEYNGCDCKKGYVYDETIKKCVEVKDCPVTPTTCPKNEKYVECVLGYCVPKKCDDLGLPIACPGIIGPCEGGCVCEDEYVRDANGMCIPKENCPKCGEDSNAVSGCGNHCNNTCSDLKGIEKPCPVDCPYNGCECRKGFVYDEKAEKCVTPKQCSSDNNTCGINEISKPCKIICPPQTCASIYTDYNCIQPQLCEVGCDCKPEYLRDQSGRCIPSEQCSSSPPVLVGTDSTHRPLDPRPPAHNQTCGENEIWKPCRRMCPPQTCASKYTLYKCVSPQPCEVGCDCIPGYLRDRSGRCIPSEQCSKTPPVIEPEPTPGPPTTEPPECGPNSRPVDCKVECSNEYCPVNNTRKPVSCVTPDPCVPGCICNLNHKRSNIDGQCIVASDCPPIKCEPTEKYDSCPSACLAEGCSDVGKKPTVCNTLVLNCEPRCVCKKGFYRNKRQICVSAKNCSAACN